jgi:hypothetical protein
MEFSMSAVMYAFDPFLLSHFIGWTHSIRGMLTVGILALFPALDENA